MGIQEQLCSGGGGGGRVWDLLPEYIQRLPEYSLILPENGHVKKVWRGGVGGCSPHSPPLASYTNLWPSA